MTYEVTSKYVPPAGSLSAPGEHYVVMSKTDDVTVFRTVRLYRAPEGREVLTDALGERLAGDGDLFREVKAAVEVYEREHADA
jgi:hypothetical protein